MTNENLDLQQAAKRHLWMHFSRMGSYAGREIPIITRGQGPYVYDEAGKRCLYGLSGLFTVQAGQGVRSLRKLQPSRLASSITSLYGATPAQGPLSSPNESSSLPRGISTECSSRPVGQKPSSQRGNSPGSTSKRSVNPTVTKCSAASSLNTEPPSAHFPSPVFQGSRPPSSHSSLGGGKCLQLTSIVPRTRR